MAPSRSSASSDVVFFTYKRRKVVFARPGTYEVRRHPRFLIPLERLTQNTLQDALNLAKKTWTALKAIPAEELYISACLPGHEDEGVVEIAPDAWQLVTNGVKQFTIGIVDEESDCEGAGAVKKEEENEMAAPMALQPLRSLPFFTQPGTAGYPRAPTVPGTSKFMLHQFLKHLTKN